jgi:ribosomal protein S18 acetylase RimI-like enzyme
MASGLDVTLRPALPGDWGLIHSWLQRGDVQRWWGSLSAAEADVRSALQTPMGLCSIILLEGRPVGYAQAQDAGTHFADPMGRDIPGALTAGTFRLDVFVGEPSVRRRGVGQAAVRLVAEEVFATSLAVGVIVVVAISHEAAVRMYERLGFTWVRVVHDPLFGPSWLMRLDRPKR